VVRRTETTRRIDQAARAHCAILGGRAAPSGGATTHLRRARLV
jgi:hypothetical protein